MSVSQSPAIHDLPPEMLVQVFSRLTSGDIARVATCGDGYINGVLCLMHNVHDIGDLFFALSVDHVLNAVCSAYPGADSEIELPPDWIDIQPICYPYRYPELHYSY